VATRAAKPPTDASGSADAYRQTAFVLDEQVQLVVDGLNFEGAAAEASSGAKYRNQEVAAALVLWSRAWLMRLPALHAIQWGNYAATTPLVRSAADFQAAVVYSLRTGAAEWQEWLASDGIRIATEQHATEFRLHAFRAAEVLAADELLGPLYRVTMDLSMPHFGASMLVAASESAPDHVSPTFGDRDFHLGLAELHLGWLLELGLSQRATLREFASVLANGDEATGLDLDARTARHLANPSRCRVEAIEIGNERRYLIHNFRREPRSAPKRILL
jgi:hypothetical protein